MLFPRYQVHSRVSLRKTWRRVVGLLMGFLGAIALTGLLAAPSWGQILSLPTLNVGQPTLLNETVFGDRTVSIGDVRLDGRFLFRIAAPTLDQGPQITGTTPLRERIQGIETILGQVVSNGFDPQELEVTWETDPTSQLPIISINDQYLMTVTTLDAQLQVQEPERWASQLTRIIQQGLIQAQQERQPEFLTRQALTASIVILITLLFSWILSAWRQRLQARQQQLGVANPQAAPPATTESPTEALALEAANGDVPGIGSNMDIPVDMPRTGPLNPVARHIRGRGVKRYYQNVLELRSRLLQVGQFGLYALALFIILGLFPYTRWLQPVLFSAPLQILLIGLAIYLLIRLSNILIDRFTSAFARKNQIDPEAYQRISLRISTFSRVLKSGAGVLWFTVGLLFALAMVGVDLVPLLAGAGIIGLAVSFAAQSLVKDMINGTLILFEDQYAVGDVINLGEVAGFVENMNLRITQLRDSEGQLITVPNSAISIVRNLSKDWSRVDLEIDLAYGTNPDHALAVIQRLAQEIYLDPAWRTKMPEPPEVLGIDEVHHAGLLIRVWIKTLPLQQWKVAREFRRRLAHVLEKEGLAIGIPQQSLYFNPPSGFDPDRVDGHQPSPAERLHRE